MPQFESTRPMWQDSLFPTIQCGDDPLHLYVGQRDDTPAPFYAPGPQMMADLGGSPMLGFGFAEWSRKLRARVELLRIQQVLDEDREASRDQ